MLRSCAEQSDRWPDGVVEMDMLALNTLFTQMEAVASTGIPWPVGKDLQIPA